MNDDAIGRVFAELQQPSRPTCFVAFAVDGNGPGPSTWWRFPSQTFASSTEVRLMDFTKWLDKTGGSPRETSDRHRIRTILGMPISR